VSHDELLARLARLDSQDRAWLLAELSPALRRELAGMLDEPAAKVAGAARATFSPTTSSPPSAAQAPGGWETLDAHLAAAALSAEPAWLVSTATRDADAQWREQLLAAMPTRRRLDIESADRGGGSLGARAAKIVLDGCREKLASGVVRDTAETRTGFGALFERLRGRA
jgi:hypothetical protein